MPIVKGKLMKKKPLVSALVAAHNEELHLSDCIESLLKQAYNKLEILVIENGESRDKTFEIAKNYERKYKNVRAFSIFGKQKGPGNAWNFGIKKAKGEIIMVCGADLRYGKDYVKKGIIPLVDGKTVALVHIEEKCNNSRNLWARAFFLRRQSAHRNNLSRVFTLVRKDYVIKRPFNSELGYADDQTVYRQEGAEFPCYDLEVYHTNPASFLDTWDHGKWVGRSINPWPVVLTFPIFPIYSVYKSIKHLKQDFYLPFIFFLPVYYSVRYFAYLIEAVNELNKKTSN